MRISDWSSDVCSSDLIQPRTDIPIILCGVISPTAISRASRLTGNFDIGLDANLAIGLAAGRIELGSRQAESRVGMTGKDTLERSEERRVGKECDRTCRSRWHTDHSEKKQKRIK